MSAHDPTTLGFYASEAEAYASRQREGAEQLDGFLTRLPKDARILELGCGGGQDSAAMLARGFDVTPSDGSPELAREAEKRLGRPVRVLLFDEVDERAVYDGIWANACLLHVPRAALPGVFARIHRALKPGGLFYARYKAGAAEGRDRFNRFYNYPSEAWLRQTYERLPWRSLEIIVASGRGYDGEPTEWLYAAAAKA